MLDYGRNENLPLYIIMLNTGPVTHSGRYTVGHKKTAKSIDRAEDMNDDKHSCVCCILGGKKNNTLNEKVNVSFDHRV
jgi:hypothetical protein